MSDPLFYAEPGTLTGLAPGGTAVLQGPEARHAVQSMRLAPGERVDLADGTGRRVSGPVLAAEPGRLEVSVETLADEPAPTPELVLVQALAKGDRDLLAVQTATELGVDAVHPWQAERSIVRWRGDRAAKAIAKWDAALLAAAKQARRTRVPHTRQMLDGGAVASVCTPGTLVLVLHEEAGESLGGVVTEVTSGAAGGPGAAGGAGGVERIALVVGPEGGISPAELGALTAAGARPVLLGRNVLRSSTAGPAAVAVLQHLLGRFGPRT